MIMRMFTPIKGCRIYASSEHPTKKYLNPIGEVILIDGSIIKFRDCTGQIDSIIWRFKGGANKFIVFGA